MRRVRSFCPHCGAIVAKGERCACRPRKARPRRQDRSGEPWRSSYGGAEYRENRQAAMRRTRGRCASCGRVAAVLEGGEWKVRGGEVDHIVKLRDGGDDSASNLQLLCIPCHRRKDRETGRRR